MNPSLNELPQGVLALRQGENIQLFEEEPQGEYVYAVAIVKVPTLPEPKSSKGEGLATIVAGKVREENVWGYLHFEKDTKQTIAAFMLDEAKCEIGKWYFIRVGIGDPEVSDEAQIPEGTK